MGSDSAAAYRKAGDMAIAEFNSYGLAKVNSKVRVDDATSNLMFGLKVLLWVSGSRSEVKS